MPEEKKGLVTSIIGAVVVLVVIVIIYTMFSGKGKSAQQEAPAGKPTASTTLSTSTAAVPPKPQVNQLTQNVIKDSVIRSTDGGETFERYFSIATTAKMGLADVLSISFHPKVSGRVIVTTYQDGLFVNEGGVNSWTPVPFPPKKIYSFILDQGSPDNRVFASGVVQDNGRIFRTDDAGVSWKAVYSEPGTGTYISGLAQQPQNFDEIYAGTSAGTLVISHDGGTSWKNMGNKIDGVITNFSFDAKQKFFVYLLTYQKSINFSEDAGLTWKNWEVEKKNEIDALKKQAQGLSKSGDKSGANLITQQIAALVKKNAEEKTPSGILLLASDPSKSGTIYASASGGLYRSTDFGKYWKKLNIIESAQKFAIRSIAINPINSDEIVFVAGKSFYKSTNAGDTWSVVPLDYTRNTSFVAYDPFDPKTIFIGISSK